MQIFDHGGNVYAMARQLGNKKLLDFSANINPLGLSDKVRQAIADNIKLVEHYPDATAYDLRQAICRFYAVDEKMLVLGNGAAELFYLLCHVLRPTKVFLPIPSFSEYERSAMAVGALVEYFPLCAADGFKLDLAVCAEALPENALVFLGNPNNPTGKLLEVESFEAFVKVAAAKSCMVIVDESFIDFLVQPELHTCRHFCCKYGNVGIIQSLTKFFAIPGLRLGFGVFSSALAERLKGAADCWNVNVLAQIAGQVGLADEGYISCTKKSVALWRKQLSREIVALGGIMVYESTVNFLLLDISGLGLTADEMCEKMGKQGILVRNCANYPGLNDSYIRIAVRSKEENDQLVSALRSVKELG